MADSDSQIAGLIERARSGDQAALGELLDLHRESLRRMAQQKLDDRLAQRIDASDLIQQTCLSVHKNIADFAGDDVAQFVGWLKQIHERNILNAARDHLQTQKRGMQRETPLDDENASPARQPSASARAMRQEETERLNNALCDLPDDEREVLQLRYLDGCSLVEISRRTGLTKDALIWLLKRAMKNLRKRFPGGELS